MSEKNCLKSQKIPCLDEVYPNKIWSELYPLDRKLIIIISKACKKYVPLQQINFRRTFIQTLFCRYNSDYEQSKARCWRKEESTLNMEPTSTPGS